MRALLSACGSRDVDPVGLLVRPAATGATPRLGAIRTGDGGRLNHTESPSRDPEHENLQTLLA